MVPAVLLVAWALYYTEAGTLLSTPKAQKPSDSSRPSYSLPLVGHGRMVVVVIIVPRSSIPY